MDVPHDATPQEISAASRQKLRRFAHGPEANEAKFRIVLEAAAVLKDPERRADYDMHGGLCDMDEVIPNVGPTISAAPTKASSCERVSLL